MLVLSRNHLLTAASLSIMLGIPADASVSAHKQEHDAFAYAFKFASAIVSDAADRGKAQEAVVRDMAASGDIEGAIRRAQDVHGWRRGVIYADLAAELAGLGRTEEAAGLVEQAKKVRASTEGWENPRISAHVAQALAVSGSDDALELVKSLASADKQYAGRAAAILAQALAVRGEFDESMKSLAALAGQPDIEMAWWRTEGYLALARGRFLNPSQRREALDQARESARAIPGWKQAESLEHIATELEAAGRRPDALTVLGEADAIVKPLPSTMPLRGAQMSSLARAWSRSGDKDSAKGLLALAEKTTGSAIVIDRPGIYADIAASHAAIGDGDAAARLIARALQAAEELANARPRALAAVEICRSMGRQEIALAPGMRTRLDALLAGLKAPW